MFERFSTTGIGSLPHNDPSEACRIIFSSVQIPFWPQLPHRSFLELMVPQYSEGFPFIRIDGENMYIEKSGDEDTAPFYEAIANREGFAISREYAAGLYEFLDLLKNEDKKRDAVKGHVTGPLTFTLSLTDSQKRPIYFDEEMRELSLELLKGKISWQIGMLRPYTQKILIFIDEPILSALGTSAYIGVDTAEASRLLSETVRHIQSEGALAGIHCCSKADWQLVLSSGLDVLSFDAYFFWDSLSLYPDDVRSHVNTGGLIAWGVVPTTDKINSVTLDELRDQLDRGLTSLQNLGISGEKLLEQALLTPSCGTGSLKTEEAARVFSMLQELRKSYVSQ